MTSGGVRHDGLDGDIDGDHAALADDDGIEVEGPEPSAVRDRELSKGDQQGRERLHVGAVAAARAFEAAARP